MFKVICIKKHTYSDTEIGKIYDCQKSKYHKPTNYEVSGNGYHVFFPINVFNEHFVDIIKFRNNKIKEILS